MGPDGELREALLSPPGEEIELPLQANPTGAHVHACLWKGLRILLGLAAWPAQTVLGRDWETVCVAPTVMASITSAQGDGGQIQHTLLGLAMCMHVSIRAFPLV